MPLQAEEDIIFVHTLAIIAHPHQAYPAALHLYLDAACACIQAIFHQLLDHCGRPVYHLARCNLVGGLL